MYIVISLTKQVSVFLDTLLLLQEVTDLYQQCYCLHTLNDGQHLPALWSVVSHTVCITL